MALLAGLRPGEEEWQQAFERLCDRFPVLSAEKIAGALRKNDGHAGSAAAMLRDLASCSVKMPDPDDAEHVSTLLSSRQMFNHTCNDHFKRFDKDENGVLDLNEVIALTDELYASFGLPQPSEGSIRGFFAATDENGDGVLSEREFRKFFEQFLRSAFFDVPKLRQLVEQGRPKVGGC